jgi:hypothetical protein
MTVEPVVSRIASNRQELGSCVHAAKAVKSFKSSYVRVLHYILRILIMLDYPTRYVIRSVQIREKELFKAPPVFLSQSIGPTSAHIIL